MPDVVSLLSSSPPGNPIRLVTKTSRAFSPRLEVSADITFDVDGFDETGDLDFRNEQAAKRRKTNESFSHVKKANVAVDLSWDIELPGVRVAGHQTRDLQSPKNDVDDIFFSSSAPVRITTRSKIRKPPPATFELSSDSLPDDPFEGLPRVSCPNNRQGTTAFSERTANLLADLNDEHPAKPKQKSKLTNDEAAHTTPARDALDSHRKAGPDDIVVISPPKQNIRKPKSRKIEDRSKKTEAAAKKAGRLAEKEAEKEKKQAERVQKARDRQLAANLAEVNKSKTNKKDAVVEMLVEISADVQGTSVGNQMEEHLKLANVPLSYVDEVDLQDGSVRHEHLGSIVRWKRKVAAIYDEDVGQWLPASRTQINSEQHVLVYLKAVDFAMIAAGHPREEESKVPSQDEMYENMNQHVAALRSRYNDCIPIYLVEGLYAWLKKNHNTKNREYTAAVRAQQVSEETAEGGTSSQARIRKRKKPPTIGLSFITEDVVEDLLLHLQLAHQPIYVQHTTSASTTAEQIHAFTNQLSTRPYRRVEMNQNLKTASFCMATGQVRTGDDAKDTYIKMLQEVQRVTPAIAYGIEGEFASVWELVKGFRKEGNLMLEDVRKSTNKDGGWSDRRLGPMVSKRLFKVFMGKDPSSMDGMS